MRDRLYRSRDERVLFGVAGGVAEWLDVDPALVRIVFALLVLTAGFGFLLYIIMALVIPEEPLGGMPPVASTDAANASGAAPSSTSSAWIDTRAERRAARRAARGERSGQGVVIFGAILILVGAWFILRRYIPILEGEFLGPVILIVIGALLVFGAMTRGRSGSGGPPASG
jgi:phage shock protein C